MKLWAFVVCFLLLLHLGESEWVKIIARRPTSLVEFQLDTDSGNVTEPRTVLTGIVDRFSTHFVLDANQSTVVLVDPSHEQHDRIRTAKIGPFEVSLDSAKTLNRECGIADELISSQSLDWITRKVYIAVDRVGTKKSGRIEACPIDSDDGCTILLSNDFGMHSLVVDPMEGYMYWLNKVENRIESAWMDGQFLNKNPFHDTFSNDPTVTVAGLILDPIDRTLYYLRVWQERCEIVSCKIHHRSSCKVVATPEDASYLAVYKDKLYWSNIRGQIFFCDKNDCRQTTKVASNLFGFERFMFLSQDAQPQRKDPNPCEIDNGGCSHFCLLHPGEPWRNCVCPIGVRLLPDNATCDAGVRRALFVAAKSSLFYVSLDTYEFSPKKIAFEENSATPVSIVDVDYDPLRETVYWLDAAKGEIRRSFLNGSGFEIVSSNLSPTVNRIAFDWLGRNMYFLDSETGRLELQRIEGGYFRRTIIPGGHEKPCCIQVDPQAGYFYFGNFYGEHTRIERAWLDGSHRQVLVFLAKVTSLTDLVIDPDNDAIYWIEGDTSKVGTAKLSTGGDVRVIAKDFQHLQALAKLGDVLYSSSSVARSITAISLGKNDYPLRKDSYSGETSDGSRYEMFDSVIFHQTALKAAVLRPPHQSVFSRRAPTSSEAITVSKSKHSRLNINGCFPGNAGCSEICVNLPASQYKCLCSSGSELQQDASSCKMPSSFFVLTQSNVTDDIMRLSLSPETPNYQPLAVPNVTSLPYAVALDSTRKFIYYAVENRHTGRGAIYRTPLIGGTAEMIIESSSLRLISSICVDPVSETLFIANGFMQRIEAVSLDGSKHRTLLWDNIDPKHLVFHPYLRKLFFVNGSEIVWIPSIPSKSFHVMTKANGKVTAMEIDVKSNKLYFSVVTDSQGAILSTNIEDGYTEQLLGGSTIVPKALTYFNDNLYMANEFTGSIDVLLKDGTSKQLHPRMPHVKSLLVAHVAQETAKNPCETQQIPEDALCLFSTDQDFRTKAFNITLACEDHFEYDTSKKKCIPPSRFVLFAAKDRLIRYRIRRAGSNSAFNEDPFVVLPVLNVGLPTSVIFDSLSPNRYLYWIDAHDRDNGRIKRSSDLGNQKTHYVSLSKESNCSQILDLDIDEIGRQLFVNCATKDPGDTAFVHVWKIEDDDELEYIGKVVAGDRKSVATNSHPSPTKIAVFGRLNALFYADCSRMLESPVIVRCKIDGRDCTTVVSRGLDCATIQLEADLSSFRLIYTTIDGIWSRDVYVDGDLRRLIQYPQGPQHLLLAPFDDPSMLIIASNETKNEEKIYQFPYDSPMKDLAQLDTVSLIQPPSEALLHKISAVRVVGSGRIEPSKLEFNCKKSECSHLCRIPLDTGSLEKRRYQCLCPLDYSPVSESSVMCARNLECQNWQFRCLNGKQCIHISRRCDSIPDCSDKSDEQPGVCPMQIANVETYPLTIYQPKSVMWNCDSGKTTAVGLHLVCNGMADCVDDSDEKHCRCRSPADDFDCTAWEKWALRSFEERSNEPDCIPRTLVCNGKPDCRNGADELPLLCQIMNPDVEKPDDDSMSTLFDFSRKQPAYIIIIVALLSALIMLCCIGGCVYCCYRRRNSTKPCYDHPNGSTTLLSTQQTMMTNAASPALQYHHHHPASRCVIPTNSTHPIELQNYHCSNNSDYGYIPTNMPPPSAATLNCRRQHPPSSYGYNTLPWNAQHQHHQQWSQPHLVVVQDNGTYVAPSSILLPAPNSDQNTFYAPPPSAASLSTYGIIKPSKMKVNITPRRSTRERNTLRRSEKQSAMSRNREEERLKEELMKITGPPSYSEMGSALECSTPRSDRPPPRTKSRRYERERLQKQQQLRGRYRDSSSSSLTSEDMDDSDHNHSQRLPIPLDSNSLHRLPQGSSSSSGPTGAIPPLNSCQSNSSGSKS